MAATTQEADPKAGAAAGPDRHLRRVQPEGRLVGKHNAASAQSQSLVPIVLDQGADAELSSDGGPGRRQSGGAVYDADAGAVIEADDLFPRCVGAEAT